MADENDTVDQVNSCRQLRARCKNKMFSEDMWLVSKDEDELSSGSKRKVYFMSYNLPDKLKNPKYTNHEFVQEINGYHFTIDFLDRNGFTWPMLIRNKQSLGLKVPDSNFSVNDVRRCVGSNRIVDVINVYTQKNIQMSMKEYQKYYEKQDRKNLFNIISLEFSHTKLENYVTQPGIIRRLDWVDLYWPKSLKSKQMDSTNIMKNMMYPKVKKYCLMSVKGCYTDFHVDFGGTSVWYHILKGVKVFWLIQPTDENLKLYQRWLLADKQLTVNNQYTFLGDVVDKCERIVLKAGQTFFIPSGWIHAVYTPKDSLVFGGNFLHSYSINMQIKISHHEDNTRIMKKFRYPYFTEMHWYALDGILRRLIRLLNSNVIDSSYLDSIAKDSVDDLAGSGGNGSRNVYTKKALHLLNGMKTILDYLNDLPVTRKCVPEHFYDHTTLLTDAQYVFDNYKNILDKNFGGDSVCREIVNKFHDSDFEDNMQDNDAKKLKRKLKFVASDQKNNHEKKSRTTPKPDIVANSDLYKKHLYRRRRTRCRICEACSKDDCGSCIYCKDMIKFGGNGRAKQSCISRQCLQPVLPSSSICIVCSTGSNQSANDRQTDDEAIKTEDSDDLDMKNNTNMVGFMQTAMNAASRSSENLAYINDQNLLMECAICYEIVHPRCLFNRLPDCLNYDIANNINDDLPNSWKCPKCYAKKENDEEYYRKQRFFKARGKVVNNGKYSSNELSRVSAESSDNTAASSHEDITISDM